MTTSSNPPPEGHDPPPQAESTGEHPLPSTFYGNWAKFVLRFRWILVLITLAAGALSIVEINNNLRFDNSIEAFASETSNANVILEAFRDEFGRDDVFMITVEGDVFSMPYLKKIQKLEAELSGLNFELESQGERKIDRAGEGKEHLFKGFPRPILPKPKKTAEELALEAELSDILGDIDDFDDDFGDDGFGEGDGAEASAADDWKGEAGGSIVEEVTSILTVRQTLSSPEGGLIVGELMDPFPESEEALAAIKIKVLGDPSQGIEPDSGLIGQVVSADGRYSSLIVRTDFMSDKDSVKVYEEILEILERYDTEEFDTSLSGMPVLNATLNKLMKGDLKRMFGISFVILTLVLFGLFRHPIGALSPLVVVLFSAIWAIAVMTLMGYPMTMLSSILPAFVICVGVADSVHLLSVYRDQRKLGLENRDAIIHAVSSTGSPIVFTSLTTAMGLISFKFASVTAIAEMGTTGAIAVGFACLNTLVILPIALSFNKKSLLGVEATHKEDFIDRFLKRLVDLSAGGKKRRNRTLAFALLVTLIAGYGASTLRVWHNPMAWIPSDQPIIEAFDITDNKLGGTANIQLLIDGVNERGVKDIELLKGMEKLDAYMREYVDEGSGEKIVGNVISLVDVVSETNQALLGGDPKDHRIPDDQLSVTDRFTAFENSGPDQLKRLMTIDATRTQMTIRLKWLEATSYEPLRTYLEKGVEKFIPESSGKVHATGAVYMLLTTIGALLMDLINSFGLAFGVISIMMVLMLRSLKLGVLAMVPNLTPIIVILGMMGFAGIPIDMANMMIASIALGIAVDDTIHFLHQFRVNYERTGDVEDSINHTIRHSGRAMFITSVILACGFFVFAGAQMANIQRFGLLIGTTVIVALLFDIMLTPALIRTFYKDRPVEQTQA